MAQLSLLAIESQRYEDSADEFRALLRDVIENLGAVEVAGTLGVTVQAIHAALSGRENRKVPTDWLPALLDMDASHRAIRALCLMAGGDFVPRDSRTDAEKLRALTVEVDKMGEPGVRAKREAGL